MASLDPKTQELLELAQEAGRLGLFEWQVKEGTIQFSPKFLSLYGLVHFDGKYETWLQCVFREDRPRIVDLIETAFADRASSVEAEFRIVYPADSSLKWMEARGIIFYGDDGEALRVVGVNVDVTERKRAIMQFRAFTEMLEDAVKQRTHQLEVENAARLKAEESLRQIHKMEAIGQLTGGIAHDFNNLLTMVLGGLDSIGRQIPALGSSPAVSRIVRAREMALHGTQRAATLAGRLLAFSRQQPLAPQILDSNKLVSGICDLLRRTLVEAIALETVLAGGLWHAFADPNQLENTLINLAVNAQDAMQSGGRLTIETANCYLDEAYVSALTEPVAAGQYVLIAVADTGAGMDKATLERAFDPFFTTKDVGKGTGLGLSQVHGFVRQSSGHIMIYSELGEGTTVKVYLPRHFDPDTGAQPRETPPNVGLLKGDESILVVEDDDTLRGYTVDILRELGYRILAAPNGVAALGIIDREPDLDLLFTDVVMPEINGRQLADEAKRRNPRLKVLFTTGYTRNAIVHHGRLDAGVELINKPFSFNELATKVREVLDKE